MLLLAFLLPPLALYLSVLGWINRRPRPVLMAGTWEFAGVLFALSGFLLVGGPALLASLDEQSRWFWLLGESGAAKTSGASGPATTWLVIRLLYFVVVAGGAAFVLWRSRRLTSVYNIDPLTVFPALETTIRRLGLTPLRTGDALVIGGRATEVAIPDKSDAIQTSAPAAPASDSTGRTVTLHVELFGAMRHATLRWDPADSPERREVERELTRVFAEASPPEQEPLLGGCLSVIGFTLFMATLVAVGLIILYRLYLPR